MTDKTEAHPEALRLAERLDCDASDADMGRKPVACTRRKTAAELRRQHAEIQQLKAQLSARQAAPDGWKLVPVDPTEKMLDAAHEGDREYTLRVFGDVMTVMQGPHDHYVAMLSAAPPPPEREPLTDPTDFLKDGLKQFWESVEDGSAFDTSPEVSRQLDRILKANPNAADGI